MFKYSGSKRRMQKYLPPLPKSCTTVVEPFAGALAYSEIHRPSTIVWSESAPLVRGLLNHLAREATQESLSYIESLPLEEKVDIDTFGDLHELTEPERTLVRLTVSGVYVGQLSSRILYPQHKLQTKRAREALPWFQTANAGGHEDYRLIPEQDPNAWWVIDPPYLDTAANYQKGSQTFDPAEFREWFAGLKAKGFVLYGKGAQELLPDLSWRVYHTRRVANIRRGGTVARPEHIAYFDKT